MISITPNLASRCRSIRPSATVGNTKETLSCSGSLAVRYELQFQSLFDVGRGYAFPCDAAGDVDLDALSERARANYFNVRAVVGRDFAAPAVRVRALS